MLFKRITGSDWILSKILFALFGFLENLLGIVKLFNTKKQMIKLSYYTEAKKKYMARKKQREQMELEDLMPEAGGTGSQDLVKIQM